MRRSTLPPEKPGAPWHTTRLATQRLFAGEVPQRAGLVFATGARHGFEDELAALLGVAGLP